MKIRVWDLCTRGFHWLFAGSVLGALIMINLDETEWHSYFGYSALVLIMFRIIWGFIGPHHARFKNFLTNLETLREYLKGPKEYLGHSPLGALSTVAILGILLLQSVTGLFAQDDILFEGPLVKKVSEAIADVMNQIHHINGNLVYGIIGLHLVAIFYYQHFKKQNLVGPMIHGDKDLDSIEENGKPQVSKDTWGLRGLGIATAMLIAALFWYVVLN